MKQFFKPTAVFACLALLFCACSDDGTEDVVSSSLGESEIRVVYPGNCQAWVKWVVPDDGFVSSCQLSWVNDEGTSSGAATYTATTGWMEEKISNMPAGTYTFSLQNFTKTGVASAVSTYSDVQIYDQNTYADSFPTVTPTANSTGSIITWDNIHEDCIGVYITYTNSSENSVTTEMTAIDAQTILTDAKACSSFTYVALYQPTFEYLGSICTGLDIIEVECTEKYTFPDASPITPANVVLSPGTNKFKVSWFTSQVTEITYIDIVIDGPGFSDQDTVRLSTAGTAIASSDLGKSVVGTFTKGVNTEVLFINKSESEDIGDDATVISKYHTDSESKVSTSSPFKVESDKMEAGEYTVTLYTVKGLTGTYSEPTTMTVTVYDETATYSQHPAISEISYDGSSARIEWTTSYESNGQSVEVFDCVGVDVTYTRNYYNDNGDLDYEAEYSTGLCAIDEVTELENAKYTYTESNGVITPTSSFTFDSYFCPENGLDLLSINNTDATNLIPVQSPTKPYDVQMFPGDNQIYVYWTLADDPFIDGVRFTYFSEDGEILATEDMPVKSLNLGDENEYGLTGTVVAGSTYTVAIQTYNDTYNNTSAMVYGYDLEVYDFASFSATCVAPYIESYEFDNTKCWFTVVWNAPLPGGLIEFTYVNSLDGSTTTLNITEYEDDLVLTDLMPGSTYTYRSSFSPVENAMDQIVFSEISAVVPDAFVYKSTFAEYPSQTRYYSNGEIMYGAIYCNNTYTNGVTNSNWAFTDLWNNNYQKNDGSGTSQYEFGAAQYYADGADDITNLIDNSIVYGPQSGMTINIDLGKTYRLSRFALHFFLNPGFSSNNIESFSLYGTAFEDPVTSDEYNSVSSDGVTPDLSNWDLLLDKAFIYQPSLYNIDFNGDEVIDSNDDSDLIYAGVDTDGAGDGSGICFDLIEDSEPIRYLRIQVHSTFGTSFAFRVQEIDLWQSGFLTSDWE